MLLLKFWRWRWLRRLVSFVAHGDLVASLYGRLPKRLRDFIESNVIGTVVVLGATVGNTVLAVVTSVPPVLVSLSALVTIAVSLSIVNQVATWRLRPLPEAPPQPIANPTRIP